MAHSVLPPSSAHIWGKPDGCRMWVLMNQLHPETEPTQESMEGDASHEIAATLIDGMARAREIPFKEFEGGTTSNGIMIDEDMYDGAFMYASNVREVMHQTRVYGGPNLGVEQQIPIPRVHEIQFGTPDCFLHDANGHVLYVWDYKYGYEVVEVYENWQLMNYIAGILDYLQVNGLEDQHLTVVMRVVQPRAFHREGPIREWRFMASDLRGYFNQLHANAAECLKPNPVATSGSHCKHCPGRHDCEAAIRGGWSLYEAASQATSIALNPNQLGTQLALVRRARKQLEYLESGLEEQVKSLVKGGKNVAGWKAEPTFGREKWNKPVEEVIQMGQMLGHDLEKKTAVTPNEARKMGIDDTMLSMYSEKSKTGIAIVQDTGVKAKRIFSQ